MPLVHVNMVSPLEFRLVIIIEDGRLGNQLYQLFHASHLAPDGLCIIIGMATISPYFSGPNVLFLSNLLPACVSSPLISVLVRLRFCLRFFLRYFPLISYLPPQAVPPVPSFNIHKGFLSSILFFDDLTFASSSPLCSVGLHHSLTYTSRFKVLIDLIQRRITSLTNANIHNRYFIHVRRGDYLHWPTPESPAVLPISWYHSAMSLILSYDPHAYFVLLSDDPDIVHNFIPYFHNLIFLSSTPLDDFVAMLTCGGGGIISPSSFSFWAAFLAKSNFPESKYFAPRYWLGWSSGQWLPEGSCQPWLSYLNVTSST